jgi:replicative DNA helicase
MPPETATAPAHRTLPHNLEAERSVLGAILIDNESMNVAAAMIDAKAFFRNAHQRIFDKMLDLSERGQPIDLVMLKEELERGGDLEEVGGPAYTALLVQC